MGRAGVALTSVLLIAGYGHAGISPFRQIVAQPDLVPGGRAGGWIADDPGAWHWRAAARSVPAVAGSTVPWSFLNQMVAARPCRLYSVSARVRADDAPPPGGDHGNAFVWLDGLDAAGRVIQTDWGVTFATRTWTEATRTVRSAPGVTAWRIRLAKRGGEGAVWFERVQVVEGPDALVPAPRGFWYRICRSMAACLVLAGIAAWLLAFAWRRAGLGGSGWAGLAMWTAAFMRFYRADLVEFKADQASTVWRAIDAVRTHILPDHGLVSSYMTYQPPGQTWIFMPPALVSSDPLIFSLYEVCLTLLAIGWAARALGSLAGEDAGIRMLWVLAVAPIGVLYSRLVWAHGLMIILGGGFLVAGLALVRRGKGAAGTALCGLASLAALTYFPGLLWGAPLIVVLWLGRRGLRWSHLVGGLLVAGLLWTPYLRFEARRGYSDLRALGQINGEVKPGIGTRLNEAWKSLVGNTGMGMWRNHTGLGMAPGVQSRLEYAATVTLRGAIYVGWAWMFVLWRRAGPGSPERRGMAAMALATMSLAAGPSLSGIGHSARPELAVGALIGQAAFAGLGFAGLGRMGRWWRRAANVIMASIVLLHGGTILSGQRAMDRHVGTVMPFEVPLGHKRAMAERLAAESAGRPVSVRYAFFDDCGMWAWLPGYTPLDRYMRQGVEMDLLLYETLGVPAPSNLREPSAGTLRYQMFYTMGWGRYLPRAAEIDRLEVVGPLGAVRWRP